MVRLNLNQQPEWYELLPGLRLKLAPATSSVLGASQEDPELRQLAQAVAESPDTASLEAQFTVDMAKAILRRTVIEWEGVEGEDGEPAPVTAAYIDALVDHPAVFNPLMEKYLSRFFTLESEKNGSAPSPNGTTEGAQRTAKPARKSAKSARGASTGRKQ